MRRDDRKRRRRRRKVHPLLWKIERERKKRKWTRKRSGMEERKGKKRK